MTQNDVLRLVKRRFLDAGLPAGRLSCHSFRATTITNLLERGVPLEEVQYLDGHSDPRTSRLYDRRKQAVPICSGIVPLLPPAIAAATFTSRRVRRTSPRPAKLLPVARAHIRQPKTPPAVHDAPPTITLRQSRIHAAKSTKLP